MPHNKNNTQTKHTDLSCHFGFLPELVTWHTSITMLEGLWALTSAFSLLSVSSSGCQYYAKCKTAKWYNVKRTRKIEGFPQNGELEVVATDASLVDGNGGYHRLVLVSSEDCSNSILPTSKTSPVMIR